MRARTRVLDVPFDVVTMNQAVERVQGFLKEEKGHIVCTPNPEIVMDAQTDSALKHILERADLVIPDGIGVVWASKYSEIRLEERVAGFDLLQNLFQMLAQTETSFYFFGGAPGVANTAARMMSKKYEGLSIVGVHNGYFDEKEEKVIIEDIKKKKPSILLVGLGAPKQEKWIFEHLEELGVRVAIGVGGSFDGMAGTVKRAPKIFRKLGLEWFYRLIKQPTRWKRMMRLPKFVIEVLRRK